ncbi:MAG: BrxA family protein, partial [Candidatus Eisenbacteria bacterium]
QNLLKKPRQASAQRYIREIRERLKGTYDWEVPIIAGHDGFTDEARLVLLAATVRYYRLVWEFIVEVIRYKITGGDFKLLGFEFESFWERKAKGAAEMREITEKSRKKLVQVLYRMLQEAGYLPSGRDGVIVAPTVPYGLTTRYASEL